MKLLAPLLIEKLKRHSAKPTQARAPRKIHRAFKRKIYRLPGVRPDNRKKTFIVEIGVNGQRKQVSTNDFFEACCIKKSVENQKENL